MLENGTKVVYYGNSTIGYIVGKTEDGRYVINAEDGDTDILPSYSVDPIY